MHGLDASLILGLYPDGGGGWQLQNDLVSIFLFERGDIGIGCYVTRVSGWTLPQGH
jgi:hypothetical protein